MLKINQLLIKKIYKPDIEPDTPVIDRSTCQSPHPCDDGVDHPGLTAIANRESHEDQPLVDLSGAGDQKSQNDRPSCFAGLMRAVFPCLGKREPNYASDGHGELVPEEGDKALWEARSAFAEHSPLAATTSRKPVSVQVTLTTEEIEGERSERVPEVKKFTGIV